MQDGRQLPAYAQAIEQVAHTKDVIHDILDAVLLQAVRHTAFQRDHAAVHADLYVLHIETAAARQAVADVLQDPLVAALVAARSLRPVPLSGVLSAARCALVDPRELIVGVCLLRRVVPELATSRRAVRRFAITARLRQFGRVIQLTAPGVPDRYQGREDWDLSLVDPDNRRPVDYARLQVQLESPAGWAEWLADWRDGRIKQQIVRHVLAARRAHEALFRDGDYQPLAAKGPLADHVLAFARTLGEQQALTVVSRLGATLVADIPLVPPARWGSTMIDTGTGQARCWVDALTGQAFAADGLRIPHVLGALPVALLLRQG
ncbi:hypothetical protein LMG23994_03398 [Cupriavidus pinatubonensis]|uniref:Uncharacterized protein n=1 Tax=Cupriavidus pinatubonensis TaxID=248026 RepID=A0ABN7YWA6_9BURK|nr:hypothetical protein LMG23994_03398 [Cupriavidus pinatubonensis]